MAQPNRIPTPRVNKAGIHIQLVMLLFPLPIMPPLIVVLTIAQMAKSRDNTITAMSVMMRPVLFVLVILFVSFMILISLSKS
jgi:hypothetical protein